MASCLPAAHVSDYMCIEFFMEFCIDGLLLFSLTALSAQLKKNVNSDGSTGKEFRAK